MPTRFRDLAKTPEPYDIQEMQQLLCFAMNTEWDMVILLAGLYGLRRSEITGLRWRNIDLKLGVMKVIEQQPYGLLKNTTTISEMASPKTSDRLLPITSITKSWFEKQQELQEHHKALLAASGFTYYKNDLVIAVPNGAPVISEHISSVFAQQLRKWGCRHIRFHDLRHSAATNMHDLTGDFFTVGEILGHTIEGIGLSLGLSNRINSVTEQYVRVRLSRKQTVLDAYHSALLGESARVVKLL
jgi:integrase